MGALDTVLTSIANRLRALSGTSAQITLAQMPSLIRDYWQYDGTEAQFIDGTLTSIQIPQGVTAIRDWTFYQFTSLTSVTISSSVTSIGRDAFCYTSIASVTIPDSVTSIGTFAFADCTSLTSVTIPNSVTSIGANAFIRCTNLTDIYCGFSQGAVSGAPWGAPNTTTIHYNSSGPA